MGTSAPTNAGKTYFVCATAQASDLDQAGFEGLSWVRVNNVGAFPDYGRRENIAEYVTIDNGKLKGKGSNDAGGGDMDVSRLASDSGQDALRTAGATKQVYAFKVVHDDAVTGFTATTDYLRGIVSGPMHPQGGDEDFVLDRFALGFVQHLRVDPEAVSS